MTIELLNMDCMEYMRGQPDNSFDAIITDPPYFKVKADAWDRQWDKPAAFLQWLGSVADEWQRLLKPNGSLYCFASPQMAARVEVLLSERFNILNNIRWVKEAGWHQKASKDSLRSFLSPWESCIFAEHYGADNIAKGEAGYIAKCDELRGFVFEPLRAYLAGEWARAGLTNKDANIATGSQMAGHYMTTTQWALPTEVKYKQLRDYANREGGNYLRREYEDLRREYEYLRREYEYLRREYEDLRRPFSVTADVPYTDVWTFKTVQAYPGKHPCEKPQDMMRHIVSVSTKPGGRVLDCFAGSGATGIACNALGRDFVGTELDPDYYAAAMRRFEAETAQTDMFRSDA